MHDAAGDEAGTRRVDHGQVLINGIDGTEHAPFPVAGQTIHDRLKDTLPATPLREIEPGEQERRHRKPDCGASRQRMIRSQCDERQKADRREQKLCGSLDEDVDDDARGGERAWDGVTRQQSRADHVAADLRHRQQDVDRLPNEPQEHACAKLRAHLWGKEQPPARPRHGNRDGAHHHDEQNSPTDACNRVANRVEAGPDGEDDERGDPAQPGDHTGLLDHSPLRSTALAATRCLPPY